ARREGTSSNGVFGAKVHWFEFAQLLAMLRGSAPEAPALPRHDRQRHRRLADHALVSEYLPELRYVHLTRRDNVGRAISWHSALHTRQWWDLGRARDGAASRPPEYDGDAIEQLERQLRADEWQWVSFFADIGVTPIMVTYEDLTADYEGTLRSLATRLEID